MFDVSEYSSTTLFKKKKKLKNKRRFSDEQIRSLEFTFGSETKLDPGKKVKLAKELGLQPRQVSIWFQNKRARWKSKQIEKDYSILLEDYNNLASKFEALKKEKQSFLIQLQKLKNEAVDKSENEQHECDVQDCAGKNSHSTRDGESHSYAKIDFELLNDLPSKSLELMLEEETHDDLMQMVEPAGDSSLTSHEEENWGGDDIMHHTDGSHQWWDFWS